MARALLSLGEQGAASRHPMPTPQDTPVRIESPPQASTSSLPAPRHLDALAMPACQTRLIHHWVTFTSRRLVLVGAYGLSSFIPGGRLATVWVHLPQPQWLNLALSSSPLLLDLTLRGILKNPAARPPELRGMVAQAMRRSTPAWNDFQRSEMVPGSEGLKTVFAPQLHRLTMPILVVHGLEDFTIPYRDVAQAFADMPNAELHPIPHAGHWTQRDAAAEFHSILARFLFKEVFL